MKIPPRARGAALVGIAAGALLGLTGLAGAQRRGHVG
jgi:hypothetical protein